MGTQKIRGDLGLFVATSTTFYPSRKNTKITVSYGSQLSIFNMHKSNFEYDLQFFMWRISFPLTFNYAINPYFNLRIGPMLHLNFVPYDIKYYNRGFAYGIVKDIRFIQPAALIAMQYKIQKRFFVDLQFNQELKTAFDSNIENADFGSLQLGFGYKF